MGEQNVRVPILWDLDQAEIKSGLSKFTIKQNIKKGRIKFIRLGAGQRGKILVNAESLCRFMEGGEQI